ncbi:putative MFS family arabinose efflux permease [Microterricola gilva]|uniref:Putative MFS family arabinose efflux permease n=1 Tax=Microterricola gilva TaxID=393267 RepID=A0A4Q8AQ31_9MICO|nr:MFS transporter [Microterricola gilva]RZU66784.1 putative MFS family arabinose efflux permease [Microterricola gilva]
MAADTGAGQGGRADVAPLVTAGARRLSRHHSWMPLTILIVNQLLAGVGVASGIAVGGILARELTGTVTLAGLAQTSSVLGAGLVAIPMARLAVSVGRHWALASGYALAFLGAGLVLMAAITGVLPLLFLGLGAFGAASAAGLQARFAATEVASPGYEARSMSLVLWATTLGSVAGPNLSTLGAELGSSLGFEPLAGPFVFSALAFAASALLAAALLRTPPAGRLAADDAGDAGVATRVRTVEALRIALRSPRATVGVVAIICSHTVMVGVMVMTPVTMHEHGLSLSLQALVISIHILGMYGASPLMGWLADRWGSGRVIALAVVIFTAAAVIGITVPSDNMIAVPIALGLLGLGWSAGMIGGSAQLTESVEPAVRVPLQGATDAAMNLAAAASAAVAGVILAWGGFPALNALALLVLVPLVVLGVRAQRAR